MSVDWNTPSPPRWLHGRLGVLPASRKSCEFRTFLWSNIRGVQSKCWHRRSLTSLENKKKKRQLQLCHVLTQCLRVFRNTSGCRCRRCGRSTKSRFCRWSSSNRSARSTFLCCCCKPMVTTLNPRVTTRTFSPLGVCGRIACEKVELNSRTNFLSFCRPEFVRRSEEASEWARLPSTGQETESGGGQRQQQYVRIHATGRLEFVMRLKVGFCETKAPVGRTGWVVSDSCDFYVVSSEKDTICDNTT